MNLATVRAGLKTRLATIAGVSQTFSHAPKNLVPPCAFVGTCRINNNSAFGEVGSAEFDVWVVVSDVADSQNVGANVDAYMSNSGASSVNAAVAADQDLGSTFSAAVTDAEGPVQLEVGGVSYEGARFTVTVLE